MVAKGKKFKYERVPIRIEAGAILNAIEHALGISHEITATELMGWANKDRKVFPEGLTRQQGTVPMAISLTAGNWNSSER